MAKVYEPTTKDSVLDDRDCEAAAKAWAEFRRTRPRALHRAHR
ncbi:hypothetical protein [Modestobacter sp. Leaf380]|nr:hypothetical protein [Modestobacter sp. Leaf380]